MTHPADNPPEQPSRRPRRRPWLPLLVLALLVAGTALAVRALTAPVPDGKSATQVHALVRIPEQNPGILDDAKGPPSADAYAAYQRTLRTHLALVKSRGVLQVALREPKVAELDLVKRAGDPVAWLEKNLEATIVEGTEFLRIGLGQGVPGERAMLVNAVLSAYVKEANRQETANQELLLADVKALYDKAAFNLAAERQRLRDLAITLGGSDGEGPSFEQANTLEAYRDHRKELAAIKSRLRAEEARQAVLTEAAKKDAKVDVQAVQLEVAVLTRQRDDMQKDEDKLKKAAEKAGLSNIELDIRKAEYDQQERIVAKLRERKERLQIESEASKSRVIIVSRAEP